MDFWARLEDIRARNNVLEHTFYQRWSKGELTRGELAVYAGEYHHAVVALADASARAARSAGDPQVESELAEHAVEEAAHVELWAEFAAAVGGTPSARPAAETSACAAAWAGNDDRDLLNTLVGLYAIESGQPAISATKHEGLTAFYDIEDGPGTAYFTLHAKLDHEHAAAERALIQTRLAGADEDELLATAETVLRANWELLDGVERLNGRA
ncbi:MAG: pyrroloquinoline-quinone synthase [Solirubrobacteraceae bacterium]|jgi:pyrroloquinoline-quinone synthase|nr:pyrroloquinoline-quinone synthase [Solirubrobacteraceae bacterium]